VGNPAVNIGQHTDQLRPISSYQNVLLSELTHYNSNPSDNNFIFPVHVNPYTSGHNHPGYEPLISPPLSYFRPYSSPHGRPQNLEYFTKFHTSRLYPYYRVNDLIQQFTPFYNSLIGKIHSYNNLNNVRNGPVTVLVQSREDPNKLVAIFVQHGLENLVTLNQSIFDVNKRSNEKDNSEVEMRFLRAVSAYRKMDRTRNDGKSKEL
ncbi:hypothetical protein Cfor_04836, partial [Coptotermes formosanus]